MAAEVQEAVEKANLDNVGGLAAVLRFADIKSEFEIWWQMKQQKAGVAAAAIKTATLTDFKDFLTKQVLDMPVTEHVANVSETVLK